MHHSSDNCKKGGFMEFQKDDNDSLYFCGQVQ